MENFFNILSSCIFLICKKGDKFVITFILLKTVNTLRYVLLSLKLFLDECRNTFFSENTINPSRNSSKVFCSNTTTFVKC